LAFSADNGRLASVAGDGLLKVWAVATGKLQLSLGPLPCALRDVAFSPKGDVLTFAAHVQDSLQADPDLDAATRDLALRLVSVRGERDKLLNEESWSVVRLPTGDTHALRRALRMAEIAVQTVPRDATYLNTLAAAQYRLGQCGRALATAQNANQAAAAFAPDGHPAALAISAMALQRLGRQDEAQAALEKLRACMSGQPWASNAQIKALADEAESLVNKP
jgi:tetratricopeptide (TPR) repeat protein